MSAYPIELDLEGRSVLVVGLGAVGRRKAAGLVAAGARVIGMDPAVEDAPPGVELLREPFDADRLEGMRLAFACATPEVNREVVAACRRLGVWVNTASEPELGDFRLPATGRVGRVGLSVSTEGASPALARLVRDLALESLGPEVAILAELMAELRPKVAATVSSPIDRRRLLLEWASRRNLERIRVEGPEAVRDRLLRELDQAWEGGTSPEIPT